MFGLYRTLLALLVVGHHLTGSTLPGGQYAVHGFFILSGYLMTLIMHESYGYTASGRLAFAGNRALRLYPSWFVVVLLAALILSLFAGPPFRASMDIPQSLSGWVQNLTLVFADPMPNQVRPRLSPATWALTIELFYYALICFGISRSRLSTWIWFALGAAYHLAIAILGARHGYAYFHILSGSLPFSIGALMFHYRFKLPAWPGWLVAIGGTLLVMQLSRGSVFAPTFYANLIVNAAIVALLIHATGDRNRDRLVGDFSYHIYILHWPVALAVYTWMGYSGPDPAMPPLFLTVLACLLISLALTRLVDRPVERWRKRLRDSEKLEEPQTECELSRPIIGHARPSAIRPEEP